MEKTPSSIYRPLETPTTIRLLCIYDGHEGYEYSLAHQDLEDEPVYIAISYTWKHDAADIPLLVDGSDFRVAENVEAILHRVCENGEDLGLGEGLIHVWIDQICIDQSRSQRALRERATQIKLMDRIYSSASLVVADLGPERRFEGFLIPLLANEGPFSYENLKAGVMQSCGCRIEEAARLIQEAIKDLMLRHFFTRAWILQEFVLSRHVCFMLGGQMHMYAADTVLQALWTCVTQILSLDNKHFSRQLNDEEMNVYHLAIIMMHFRAFQVWHPSHPASRAKFSDVVKLACRFDATVEHDKIYGCLALADRSFRDNFEISYTESLERLSRRIVYSLISDEQSVNILRQAKLHRADVDECSWSLQMSGSETSIADSDVGLLSKKIFDAGASTFQVCQPWLPSSPHILSLAGHIVDHVILAMPGLDDDCSTYRMVQACYRTLAARSNEEPLMIDAFWRTIIADEILPKFSGQVGRAHSHHVAYYLCWLCVEQDKVDLLYTDSLRRSVEHLGAIYENSARLRLSEGRLCLTAKGRLGNLPEAAAPKDQIVIFQGGDVPFVIRPRNGFFRLLGECYVHGIMDGEGILGVEEPSQIALV